jgi:hypothetical protein
MNWGRAPTMETIFMVKFYKKKKQQFSKQDSVLICHLSKPAVAGRL